MATRYVNEGGSDTSPYDTEAKAATSLATALTGASASDTIEITGTWTSDDTSVCTISAANLTIQAVGDSKCDPYAVASPSHYRLRCNSSGNHCFTVSASGTTIDGLEIKQASTGSSDEIFRMDTASCEITVKNSLLYFGARNEDQDVFYVSDVDGCTINLENCMVWDAERAVVDFYSTTSDAVTVNINSCSFYEVGFGTGANDRSGLIGTYGGEVTAYVYNSLIHVNASSYAFDDNSSGYFDVTVDRCIYSDSTWGTNVTPTVNDCLTSHNWTDDNSKSSDGDWVIVEDVTSAPYDFRLQTNTYNEAQDMHADASGPNSMSMPAADIVGTSRPVNTNYDCGAFEYTGGEPEGSTVPLIVQQVRRRRG